MASDSDVSATHQFVRGSAVVQGKGLQIDGAEATGQCAEVNGAARYATAGRRSLDVSGPITPGRDIETQPLAQGGAETHGAQAEFPHKV